MLSSLSPSLSRLTSGAPPPVAELLFLELPFLAPPPVLSSAAMSRSASDARCRTCTCMRACMCVCICMCMCMHAWHMSRSASDACWRRLLATRAGDARAGDARWRTASISEARSLTSSLVTVARCASDWSAMRPSADAAMPIAFSEPLSSCRTNSGTAPAFAIAARFSGSCARLRSTSVACSWASAEPLTSILTRP